MRWDQQIRWQVCSVVNVEFHFHRSKFLKSRLVSGSLIPSKCASFVVAVPGGDAGLAERGGDPGPPFARRWNAAGASRVLLSGFREGAGRSVARVGKSDFLPHPPTADGRGYRQGCYPGEPRAPLKTHFSRPAYQMTLVAVSSGISSKPDRSGTGLKAALVVATYSTRAGFLLRPRKVSWPLTSTSRTPRPMLHSSSSLTRPLANGLRVFSAHQAV